MEQTEASKEGETQISSETTETNVTTTGGNTVSSSEVITYEVTDIYNESIEAGMVEILNTAGFELIDELVASGSQSSAKLIDTFVSSHFIFHLSICLICPSCNEPIVGTNPRFLYSFFFRSLRISEE